MSADAIQQRRAWASAHIQVAKTSGTIPRYGTPQWHALAPTSPLRWAAVVIAAECWAVDGDDIPGRMRRELANQAAADAVLDAEEFAAMAAGVRARASLPSYAELQHRRGELTDEQLATVERQRTEFVAGRTNRPPTTPRAGTA